MPKQKSHRGAAKRFRVTATGKVVRRRSMHSHILTKKTRKRKRNLRKAALVKGRLASAIRNAIPG